jgi:hypothetical protein
VTEYQLLDPTNELEGMTRPRAVRPTTLAGSTIGLLDIAKRKSDVFLDRIEQRLVERGFTVVRFMKDTNTRTASIDLQQEISRQCGAVIEALAD